MTQDNVWQTLEDYARAYCAKDLDALMDVFVEGEEISLIGTGADELCTGRTQVAEVFVRNFRDATAAQFEWGWRDVIVHDRSATVAAALNIHLDMDGERVVVPVR